MEETHGDTVERQRRAVRIVTRQGMIEGHLNVSKFLRTLDDLNVVSCKFLTVVPPLGGSAEWSVGDEPMMINTASILFLMELSEFRPDRRKRVEADRLRRSAVRLRVEEYAIHGYLHIPPGGDPMRRLRQESHPFLALTSASVVGCGLELESPFLAVNRFHVLSAQEIPYREILPEAAIATGQNVIVEAAHES